MKTIHVILNAHIDPVWLWPWQSGLGEALATCRSACDRLDANPDAFFTRGEAWIYEQIEKLDPELFERIRRHINAGRWEITGGWYIQPDCNLPSYWAMEKQIALGREYFMDRFGIFPRFAFNVDSFGSSAALPGLMRSFGQDRYVTTRPSKEEMPVPSRLFRWRGTPDGPEITVCKPSFANAVPGVTLDFARTALDDLPEGCEDGIICCGVGDHGGGPTENMIAWLRRHAEDIPGWRIEFSTLGRYFRCIEPLNDALPLVVGDLHPNQVGCYSVYRPVKTNLRRAEHLLAQAETLAPVDPDECKALHAAWKRVCFHHFHDTLAGTCTASAYVAVLDQLGGAAAAADETLQYGIRRLANALPPNPLQRIVILNASSGEYDGFVEYEPCMGAWTHRWRSDCTLIDENGEHVEFQLLDAEPQLIADKKETIIPRFFFRLKASPGEVRVLRIQRPVPAVVLPPRVAVAGADRLTNQAGVTCLPDRVEWAGGAERLVQAVSLHSIRDMTDTWGHDVFQFGEEPLDTAVWDDPVIVESGPLVAVLSCGGRIGRSSLRALWRVHADEPFAELTLRVHWQEQFRMLKLVLPFESVSGTRTDGIMGDSLVRANNGVEWPLRDWTLLTGAEGRKLGIVCPDVYALDATDKRVRLTLLRSPVIAHHDPSPHRMANSEFCDQGVHTFRFRFFPAPDTTAQMLDRHAMMLQRPPVMADLTRGMPAVVIGSEGLMDD